VALLPRILHSVAAATGLAVGAAGARGAITVGATFVTGFAGIGDGIAAARAATSAPARPFQGIAVGGPVITFLAGVDDAVASVSDAALAAPPLVPVLPLVALACPFAEASAPSVAPPARSVPAAPLVLSLPCRELTELAAPPNPLLAPEPPKDGSRAPASGKSF